MPQILGTVSGFARRAGSAREASQRFDEWITLADHVAGIRSEIGPAVQTTGRPADFDGIDQG